MKNKYYLRFANAILFLSLFGAVTLAQTPPEFTYQGSLKDGANAANGNYDFEIKLYNALTGPALIGTRIRLNVPVTNGVFTVKLDFAGAVFTGEDRFLEIAVKPAGSPGGYQQLLPRQQVNWVPYAFRSVGANQADNATTATNATTAATATNALQLGGVAANQYVITTDSRMTDARSPLPGSGNYIQRDPATVQSGGFNIIGKGSAGTYDVITNYQIGGNRVLGIPGTNNVFAGVNAGNANTTGEDNTFVGRGAGIDNTLGSRNSFFGSATGQDNITGIGNAFFGFEAGKNSTADFNAFFGSQAGQSDTTGERNSFFGNSAGASNTGGSSNSFFGQRAGNSNLNGADNSFFGREAGFSNTGGDRNSFFGRDAGRSNIGGIGNAFFGFEAGKNSTADFNSFFGSLAGQANGAGVNNAFFGNSAGLSNTTGDSNTFAGFNAGGSHSTGGNNTFVGANTGYVFPSFTSGNNNTLVGASTSLFFSDLSYATAIGAGALATASNTVVLGRSDDFVYIPGLLTIPNLAVAGSTNLCRNSFDRVGTCSSSLRYKTEVQNFNSGLNIVKRLRPITFNWKDGGMNDVGFAAEEVEQIEPLLATYNKDGQIEGVKYGQIATVLVNAVKEQQAQIEQQQKQLQQQQLVIDGLKKLVCSQNAQAEVCREDQK